MTEAIASGTAQQPHRWLDPFQHGNTTLHHADCFQWAEELEDLSIQAIVTDPPYGLHEYSAEQQAKMRDGHGGVWRLPPSFDGHTRSPLPRFTTLTPNQLNEIEEYFVNWGQIMLPIFTVDLTSKPWSPERIELPG